MTTTPPPTIDNQIYRIQHDKACYTGDITTVKTFHEENNNFDKTYSLIEAIRGEQYELCEYLLKNGADVNRTIGLDSDNLLMRLIKDPPICGIINIKLCELLIEYGCNVNHTNFYDGDTPLFYSVHFFEDNEEYGLPIENRYEVAEMLLKHGATINIKRTDGMTPLHLASYNELYDICVLFVENGADVLVVDSEGKRASECALNVNLYDTDEMFKIHNYLKQCELEREQLNHSFKRALVDIENDDDDATTDDEYTTETVQKCHHLRL